MFKQQKKLPGNKPLLNRILLSEQSLENHLMKQFCTSSQFDSDAQKLSIDAGNCKQSFLPKHIWDPLISFYAFLHQILCCFLRICQIRYFFIFYIIFQGLIDLYLHWLNWTVKSPSMNPVYRSGNTSFNSKQS